MIRMSLSENYIHIAVPAQYEHVLAQLSGSYGSVPARAAI